MLRRLRRRQPNPIAQWMTNPLQSVCQYRRCDGVSARPADADQLLRHARRGHVPGQTVGQEPFPVFRRCPGRATAVRSRMRRELRRCWQPSSGRRGCVCAIPTAGRRYRRWCNVLGCGRWFAGNTRPARAWLAPARISCRSSKGQLAGVDPGGEWVIRAALRQMAQWLTQRADPATVSCQRGAFVPDCRQRNASRPVAPGLGRASRIPADLLKLEVLETSALPGPGPPVSRQMHACMAPER